MLPGFCWSGLEWFVTPGFSFYSPVDDLRISRLPRDGSTYFDVVFTCEPPLFWFSSLIPQPGPLGLSPRFRKGGHTPPKVFSFFLPSMHRFAVPPPPQPFWFAFTCFGTVFDRPILTVFGGGLSSLHFFFFRSFFPSRLVAGPFPPILFFFLLVLLVSNSDCFGR